MESGILVDTIYSNIKPCISPGDYVLASTCQGIFHSLGSMAPRKSQLLYEEWDMN
ncbi:hypothetical protein L208DRAFT_1413257 [Tricholoma matsutake]|nr:hypothetical protein L208DRAFT_1413257 [Tricholoma matsutake 945]